MGRKTGQRESCGVKVEAIAEDNPRILFMVWRSGTVRKILVGQWFRLFRRRRAGGAWADGTVRSARFRADVEQLCDQRGEKSD
jgi:hypothetical protein